jgi:hypothetical protein
MLALTLFCDGESNTILTGWPAHLPWPELRHSRDEVCFGSIAVCV